MNVETNVRRCGFGARMCGDEPGEKKTYEREFNEETVLHDWCHGKKLYEAGSPVKDY